jgi:lysophospholipase L1-like esterase
MMMSTRTSRIRSIAVVASAVAVLLTAISARAQTVAPVRVMCVGDSITAGYTDNPTWAVPFEFGYRSGLYLRLKTNGYPIKFVGASLEPWNGLWGTPTNKPSPDLRTIDQDHHRGYGGQGTSYVLSNVGAWLTSDNPDVVLLMIGINDNLSGTARNNLSNIVRTVVTSKPNADLIVAQITPMASYSQWIVDYNTYIRNTLVPSYQAQGKHVTTVDQYTNLLTSGSIDPSLFSNGINHPNAVAYDRMAQTWYAGIQAVHPSPPRVMFTSVRTPGSNMILTGTGGAANSGYHVLSTSNLALPMPSWPTNAQVGTFDGVGDFAYTNPISPGVPIQFFRLQIP